MTTTALEQAIFTISSDQEFEALAMEIFHYQAKANPVYREYLAHINRKIPECVSEIPFMPISFFKTHRVSCKTETSCVFRSSGTGKEGLSQHLVFDEKLYHTSARKGFEHAYGSPDEFAILALLPNYLERKDSSLVSMIDQFLNTNTQAESGFYLYDHQALYEQLKALEAQKKPTLLIGVSFALLDFFEAYNINLKHTIVMETGGMKGRRKELTRTALHQILKDATGLQNIHSEYGMTELLSQAYAKTEGRFVCPNWMNVLPGDPEDPFGWSKKAHGQLKIIDLANLYSCSFIQTQDLGKFYPDGSFEVLGRLDYSDLRGCNLMV
ncbi:MAG: acyl transferase [Flavobacteriales bacterium]